MMVNFFDFDNNSCQRKYFIQFFWGSFVGFVPLTLVFAIYGSGGAKRNIWQLGLATILLIFSMFSRRLMKKWFHAKNVGNDMKSF
jgi:uncharacterized membrane protein YdjX (TVP38/TMEM64 family)